MGDFNKNSNFNANAGIEQVKFGQGKLVLDVELNEMQQIANNKMRAYIEATSGNSILGKGTMTYTGGVFKIKDEVALVEGIIVNITELKLTVGNGEDIFLKVTEREASYNDVLKLQGNEQEDVLLDNYLVDTRIGQETTRRLLNSYNLTKTDTEIGSKYLKLGKITGGQFEVEIENTIRGLTYEEI